MNRFGILMVGLLMMVSTAFAADKAKWMDRFTKTTQPKITVNGTTVIVAKGNIRVRQSGGKTVVEVTSDGCSTRLYSDGDVQLRSLGKGKKGIMAKTSDGDFLLRAQPNKILIMSKGTIRVGSHQIGKTRA